MNTSATSNTHPSLIFVGKAWSFTLGWTPVMGKVFWTVFKNAKSPGGGAMTLMTLSIMILIIMAHSKITFSITINNT